MPAIAHCSRALLHTSQQLTRKEGLDHPPVGQRPRNSSWAPAPHIEPSKPQFQVGYNQSCQTSDGNRHCGKRLHYFSKRSQQLCLRPPVRKPTRVCAQWLHPQGPDGKKRGGSLTTGRINLETIWRTKLGLMTICMPGAIGELQRPDYSGYINQLLS